MSKKVKYILICTTLVMALTALLVAGRYFDRIPANPSGTVGNTAGNINNAGLFCESDGMIYFSNPLDNGSLYSMTPDEQNITKLGSSTVRNILAGGKYLYYFQTIASGEAGLGYMRTRNSFNRCLKSGKGATSLTTDVVVSGQLVDNHLYLMTVSGSSPSFYKLKLDSSDKQALATYMVNPACARDGVIYYNGTQNNHYLYTLNTADDTVTELWEGNIWYPCLEGNYIYYMDVANNYRLCRYDMNQKMIEILTNDRVDCFNVGGGYIYYQCNSATSPALKMMGVDGSNPTVVAEGNYTNINMTSRYVYFQEFGNEDSLYHCPLGSNSYSTF
ncbi:MAG: DUF5050 domain-containing protein [bacterium]|nr:DUF5050 domain-containing protein [bacterium]MCM1374147.1 DUF5050 domain-containing protein [Muribaculum sp.]